MERFNEFFIVIIEIIITEIKKNDCKASVHTIVLTPDLFEYSQINTNTAIMVIK